MKTISLAFRNIMRNKRRTFITLSAIISGVCSIVIFGGFIEFTFQALRESTIHTQLGHIQIYQQGYNENGVANPANYLIKEPEKVESALKQLPEVLTVTSRLTLSGLISTGNKSLSAKVTGIVPAQEEEFSAFETLIEGQQLDQEVNNAHPMKLLEVFDELNKQQKVLMRYSNMQIADTPDSYFQKSYLPQLP